jgi:hypothetical protein
MSDDLIDELLGKDRGAAAPETAYKICLFERCANSIEAELDEKLALQTSSALPLIFIDETTGELDPPSDGQPEPWTKYFDGRVPSPWEAAELAKEITAMEAQVLAEAGCFDRIAIAHDLGPRATKAQYETACAKEGVTP